MSALRTTALACFLLAACAPGPDAPNFSFDADTSEVRRLMEAARIPGLTLAHIDNGQITATESHGLADVSTSSPVDATTLFEAASLSKPVFATIVLRLVERGDLALDGLTSFRIEIATDGEGAPTKIVGHYLAGDSDESQRDD